jgi:FlgN protein
VTGLLDHLDRQIASAQRMLQILLAQGEAIRRQDVEGVLARLGDVQAEMVKRVQLERERDRLVQQAAVLLGCAVPVVTLEGMLQLVDAQTAEAARRKSAELRGLLAETTRVHGQNKLLIRQELAFLDHLMRVLSGAPQGGYTPVGATPARSATRIFDARV